MKKTLIIAGFAGIGKTTLAKKYKNVVDIESSPYKWDYSNMDTRDVEKLKGLPDRKINEKFPENYIQAIKEAASKYDIVCAWIHPEEILPIYDKNNIDYVLAFPSKEALTEYKQRFLQRGNNNEYINKVLSTYDKRFKQFMSSRHEKFILEYGETLEDKLIKEGYVLIKKGFN